MSAPCWELPTHRLQNLQAQHGGQELIFPKVFPKLRGREGLYGQNWVDAGRMAFLLRTPSLVGRGFVVGTAELPQTTKLWV